MFARVRALITGIGGFVGRHLTDELVRSGDEVHGLDVVAPAIPVVGATSITAASVLDRTAIADIVEQLAPEAIYHLAGAASAGASFADPVGTWDLNLGGTLAVLEAVRERSPATRIVTVTSAEVYGLVPLDQLPVDEHTPTRPHSPYGASKLAADVAARQYFDGYGVQTLRVRPFNHIGPGQDARFVVPSVASQIAAGERDGADPIEIAVGNLDSRRDFLDVRDVVRAYRLIAEQGDPRMPYVVAGGRSRAIRELVDTLVGLAERPVTVTSDPARRREGEQPDLYGSSARLAADTGWSPVHSIDTTLRDTLQWWRTRSAKEA